MKRRTFIRTSGAGLAALLLSTQVLDAKTKRKHVVKPSAKITGLSSPDYLSALVNGKRLLLKRAYNGEWTTDKIAVRLINHGNSTDIEIKAPNTELSDIRLNWITSVKTASVLNDHWERTYGDCSWHKPVINEPLPWYFLEITDEKQINGYGVKTGSAAFCHWHLSENTLSLTLDTRSGGSGVRLDKRTLKAATILSYQSPATSSLFQAQRQFLKLLCDQPRMAGKSVYGINDWYFTYGNNSEKLILKHTEMMAPMAENLDNRPFSVIDAGWFQPPVGSAHDCCFGDNMRTPNQNFGDMAKLADKIRKIGMRPAIWTRPLCASYKDPRHLLLPVIKGRTVKEPILDPTIPENLERIRSYFKLYNQWSYEMVKFDFTSYDIFGKWGFEMIANQHMTEEGWKMADQSLTNAEIVLQLYKTIREAAGKTYIIGCNTFSHLAAGLFELNRIGDDTSGNEWSRTRKMGVNTLAFRGAQQGVFYAADGDCVGLTTKVPWDKNKQWMELLAKSGTPLFISAQPEALGQEQKEAIRKSFEFASRTLPVGEPLDWQETAYPKRWNLNGSIEEFNWD